MKANEQSRQRRDGDATRAIIDDIPRADVIDLVEGLVTVGTPTVISSVFSFAMDADLVNGNPCARLRRRAVETIGRRVLADDEIRLFCCAGAP
jgi:hypothetical protein